MKKRKKILISSLIILLIMAIFYFGFMQSIFTSPLYTAIGKPEIQTIRWNGFDVELESTKFGSYTDGQPIEGVSDSTPDLCGTDDNKVSISNNFNNAQVLFLSSSMTTRDWECSKQNYLSARINITKSGNLTIDYEVNVFPYKYQTTSSSIESNLGNIFSISVEGNKYGGLDRGTNENVGKKIFRIDEPRIVEIATGVTSSRGSASALAQINFIADPEIIENEIIVMPSDIIEPEVQPITEIIKEKNYFLWLIPIVILSLLIFIITKAIKRGKY